MSYDTANNSAVELQRKASERNTQAARGVQQQLRDHPLITGALGIALGAAIGAALPRTAQEDELMGDAADHLKSEAASQATGAYEQGREKVSELHDSAKEEASSLSDEARKAAAGASSRASEGDAAKSDRTGTPAGVSNSSSTSIVRETAGISTSGSNRL